MTHTTRPDMAFFELPDFIDTLPDSLTRIEIPFPYGNSEPVPYGRNCPGLMPGIQAIPDISRNFGLNSAQGF